MFKWIEPEEKKLHPLTHPQKRVWYTEQITPGTGMFNIGGICRIKGEIDPDIMEKAVLMMMNRNHSMRLKVINLNGEPKQYVRDIEEFSLPYIDFSDNADPTDAAYQWMEKETKVPFENGENFKTVLIKVAQDDYYYYQKCHHIISDGWSYALLKEQLEDCYNRCAAGEPDSEELPPSYLQVIDDEEEYKESKKFKRNRKFWMEKFDDIKEAVNLSPKVVSSNESKGRRHTLIVDSKTNERLNNFINENRSSVYSFFMAVLYTYIYRFTGERDITIGTPVLNRSGARQKNTFGMFVSTMPFRTSVDENLTFLEFLKMIMKEQRRYYRNQRYPMDLLVKDLDLAQQGNNKLFEISLSYQNSTYEQSFAGHDMELAWTFNGYEENSLTIHINDRMGRGELDIDFDYALDAFDHEHIEKMSEHFINITNLVLDDPQLKLFEIDYMAEDELDKIIYQWNQTQVDYPEDKCIYQLFEEQVERTPDRCAVSYQGQELTYRQLNNLSNQLAGILRDKGIKPDQLVGLMVERSLEAVVGIYGVLKSGGAYLPIDSNNPEERCRFMLEDTQCKILLIQSKLRDKIPGDYQGEIIELESLMGNAQQETANLTPLSSPENMSYIIYTSGSTGKPKGVMVEHGGLTNYIWWAKEYYCSDSEANFPLYSSLSFDLTVTSIFVPLVSGGSISVMPEEKGNLISKVVDEDGLRVVKLTPAHLSLIKDKDNSRSSVDQMILGGEDLKAGLAREAVESFQGKLTIHNEYGPTETVVGCIVHQFDLDEEYSSVLIGKPIQNTQIYILDERKQPVPVGAVGEIYISGAGVARGYLNRPQLSKDRFVDNPFLEGEGMYKSGDLARYLPDGKIQYLGRVDNQVKVNGFRIEIGEIESALLKHPAIDDGVVAIKLDHNDKKYLVGYFISDEKLTTGDIRAHLLELLPEYMVPTRYVSIDEIPLTTNGKVDRTKLPEPDSEIDTGVDYVPPETEKEIIITQIWSDVLGLDKVGIFDNFFELGGDSIKAIQISTRLKEKGLNCQVQDIFNHKTINQVALHTTTDVEEIKAIQGIVEGQVSLTPVMNWFFDHQFENADYWNQSVLLEIKDDVEIPLLERTFGEIIQHHDALRLNYDPHKEQLYYQNRYLEGNFELPIYDLTEMNPSEQLEELKKESQKLKAGFNIEDSLLIKAAIFELGQAGRRLLITAHHLVVDGFSWRIILEDLASGYLQFKETNSLSYGAKTTSVMEWAEELGEYSKSKESEEEIPYWESTLEAIQPIPTDYEGEDFGTIGKSESCQASFEEDETQFLLKKANETYNTRIDELLLVGLAKTISEWLDREQIFLQLEGHGREEIVPDLDLSRTVGWFTSIYPVKLDLTGRDKLSDKIIGVKEQLRKVPEKGIGYGILKYMANYDFSVDEKETGILFNYLGQFDQDLDVEVFDVAEEETGPEVGRANQRTNLLEIIGMVVGGKLDIEIQYSTQRFKKETISNLLSGYMDNMRRIMEHVDDESNFTFTPSDFDTVELSEDDLSQLFG